MQNLLRLCFYAPLVLEWWKKINSIQARLSLGFSSSFEFFFGGARHMKLGEKNLVVWRFEKSLNCEGPSIFADFSIFQIKLHKFVKLNIKWQLARWYWNSFCYFYTNFLCLKRLLLWYLWKSLWKLTDFSWRHSLLKWRHCQ